MDSIICVVEQHKYVLVLRRPCHYTQVQVIVIVKLRCLNRDHLYTEIHTRLYHLSQTLFHTTSTR